MAFIPRVRRTRRGDYRILLSAQERELLRSLPGELRKLLSTDDPSLDRLFPPAYPDDPERNAEYLRMVREDLVAGRMEALKVMEDTLDAERVDEEQLTAWMAALNDLRLVLGTRLDVSEDVEDIDLPPDDPRGPAYGLYFYLGWLEGQVVEALSTNRS